MGVSGKSDVRGNVGVPPGANALWGAGSPKGVKRPGDDL